jgi:Spy/CpxP family protein refolding chaperone
MKNRLVTICSLLAVGFMSVSVLNAQDAPPPGGGRPDRPGGPRGGAGLGLDEKQRELLREAMQKNGEEQRALNEKYQAAQKELVQAAIAEKYDEKVIREKADALSKIQADMVVLRAKSFSSVAPTLKPEQREMLINTRMGAAMVLGGGVTGGGPGGPGGGGGRPPRGGGGGGGGGGQGQ